MRKIFLLILFLFFSFTLLACGNKDNNEESNPDTPSEKENGYYNEANFIQSDNEISETKLEIYDGPEYLNPYEGVSVKVNNNDLFVYSTRVNHGREFSWTTVDSYNPVVIFDFEGKVLVEIEVKDTNVTKAKVSPLVYGIEPEISGNKISFYLEYTDNYVVEYNDDSDNAIHIFANPIDDFDLEEAQNDENINLIYIGPGVYKADAIPVTSNSVIYLAGGAYVYGRIRTEYLENVTIRGRGIISGEIFNRRSESEYTIPIEMRYTDGIKIEGVTILDPAGWTIALYKSTNIVLDNVKIITARQNGDGISVQSCQNVQVLGGFVRTWDDSLVVKNEDGGTTDNILFDGVNVWTDLAQSMEIGYECNGATMTNITFQNITVIHNYHKAVMSIHNADDAKISDVTYKNITVEDGEMLGDNRTDGENDFLIDMTIAYNQDWSSSTDIKGTISNVTFENIYVYEMLDSIKSRLNGYTQNANIEGITIKNLVIGNKTISSEEDLGLLKNSFTSNVTITSGKATGAIKTLPYKLSDNITNVSYNVHSNVTQEGMLVPKFAYIKGDLPYIGVADSNSYTVNATHSKGTKTNVNVDDGSGEFSQTLGTSFSASDRNTETMWTSGIWKGEDDEFATLTFDFGGKLINIGVIRILGNQDNSFFYTYSFQIWGKKVNKNGEINENYTRILSLKDYEMSPASGNAIDVNITTQEYAGIQIRFYKKDYVSSPEFYQISEVEFYSPSLSYNKSIVDSTTHEDVYPIEKVVDGDATGTSYYESAELPAFFVIDLGDTYSVNTIVLRLPPSLVWDARVEEIEISYSTSDQAYNANTTKFTVLVSKTAYLFDPATGNRNIINLDVPTDVRYLKVVIYSNNISAGYNAQLSEISVYGE